MTEYRHQVSGFFVKREEAPMVFSKPNDRGFPPDQLKVHDNDTAAREPAPEAHSNTALISLIVNDTVGAAIGTDVGVLAQVVLASQTRSEQETAIAQEVIKEAVSDFKDARTV